VKVGTADLLDNFKHPERVIRGGRRVYGRTSCLAKNGALADGAIVRDHSSQKPTEVFARAAIVEGLSNLHLWLTSVGHHDHRLSWRPR
jgi:hypothetical protein